VRTDRWEAYDRHASCLYVSRACAALPARVVVHQVASATASACLKPPFSEGMRLLRAERPARAPRRRTHRRSLLSFGRALPRARPRSRCACAGCRRCWSRARRATARAMTPRCARSRPATAAAARPARPRRLLPPPRRPAAPWTGAHSAPAARTGGSTRGPPHSRCAMGRGQHRRIAEAAVHPVCWCLAARP